VKVGEAPLAETTLVSLFDATLRSANGAVEFGCSPIQESVGRSRSSMPRSCCTTTPSTILPSRPCVG